MPKFTYEDTQTGKTLTLDRETEPSETELTQLFSTQQPNTQQPAARQAEQPIAKPATVPDSAMQFLPQAAPTSQRVPAAEFEVMSGGFSSALQAPLLKRPTQTDAIRKAVELSMGGAFGAPTVSQISQIYFNMQSDYDRAIKPVDKSERDKAFEIGMNRFMFENKRKPDPKETELLYKQAATVGTKEYSDGGLMMDQGGCRWLSSGYTYGRNSRSSNRNSNRGSNRNSSSKHRCIFSLFLNISVGASHHPLVDFNKFFLLGDLFLKLLAFQTKTFH